MKNHTEQHPQRLRQARERKPKSQEVLDLAERMVIEKCLARGQSSVASLSPDPDIAHSRMEKGRF